MKLQWLVATLLAGTSITRPQEFPKNSSSGPRTPAELPRLLKTLLPRLQLVPQPTVVSFALVHESRGANHIWLNSLLAYTYLSAVSPKSVYRSHEGFWLLIPPWEEQAQDAMNELRL